MFIFFKGLGGSSNFQKYIPTQQKLPERKKVQGGPWRKKSSAFYCPALVFDFKKLQKLLPAKKKRNFAGFEYYTQEDDTSSEIRKRRNNLGFEESK